MGLAKAEIIVNIANGVFHLPKWKEHMWQLSVAAGGLQRDKFGASPTSRTGWVVLNMHDIIG